jgi:hypothetical protein
VTGYTEITDARQREAYEKMQRRGAIGRGAFRSEVARGVCYLPVV